MLPLLIKAKLFTKKEQLFNLKRISVNGLVLNNDPF